MGLIAATVFAAIVLLIFAAYICVFELVSKKYEPEPDTEHDAHFEIRVVDNASNDTIAALKKEIPVVDSSMIAATK